jgi:hypothetical protein
MISTSGWNMIPRQGGNAAEVNYAMFLAVWTILEMLVFIPVALKPPRTEDLLFAQTILDGLSTLFYFSGGVALSAAMGIHSCTCFYCGLCSIRSSLTYFIILSPFEIN